MKYRYLLFLALFALFQVYAHEDEHEHAHGHEESKFSQEKAIQEVNHEGGIKLSSEALELLNIQTVKARNGEMKLPLKSLVFFKKMKGFYLKRKDFFYFIESDQIKKNKNEIIIFYEKFRPNDEVVTAGVELLRVSDVFAKDDSEYGHGH